MFLDTIHKKKSAIITVVIAVLLLVLFFSLGLRYLDPPISYGMEVNFGSSNVGSGDLIPKKPLAAKPIPVQKEKEVVEESTPPPPKSNIQELSEVVTEKESTVAVDTKKEKDQAVPDDVEKVKEPEPEPKPTVSEATKKMLSNFINNQPKTGEEDSGNGDDLLLGDKGKLEGNPYATRYFDEAGLGKGKGYGLNGRSLMSDGRQVQECNEAGTVVVRITVNRDGRVVSAEPGVKGTTNTHPCLMEPAKQTALLHRWYPDAKAPQKQIGFVVIQFKLVE